MDNSLISYSCILVYLKRNGFEKNPGKKRFIWKKPFFFCQPWFDERDIQNPKNNVPFLHKEKLQQRKEERRALGKSTSSSLNKSRTSSTESSKSFRSNSRDLSPTSSVEGFGVGAAGGVITPKTARKLQKTKAILLSPTKLLPPKSKSEEGTETTGGEEGRKRGQVRVNCNN